MGYKTKIKRLLPAFTLIEILIATVILAVLALLTGSIFISHLKLFNNVKQLVDISSSNKLALDELITQIREGEAIVTTCPACSPDSTSTTKLVLRLWPIDSNKEPFEPTSSNYDYIVYKRDATDAKKLIKKIIADATSSRNSSTKVMASDISNLTFSYNNADPTLANEVTVNVSNTLTVADKTQTVTQQVKAVLRNR